MSDTQAPVLPPLADGRHFTVEEMRCHDNSPYPAEFADRLAVLMPMLDAIRDAWNAPIRVVSGYRSPAHNQALIDDDEAQGSHQVASGSQHVEGRAADICPVSGPGDVGKLHSAIMGLYLAGKLEDLGGIAVYPVSGWVHVDTRPKVPDGHLAQWPGT